MPRTLQNILLAFFAGAFVALSHPSVFMPGWLPFIFIAFPLFLFLFERATGLWCRLGIILFFNLGLNLVGFYWIPHTLREFGQLPWIVSIILGALFSFILQPHWWVYALFRKYRPEFAWNSQTGIILSALIITILERFVPQQFAIFAGSPWLHLAPYLGLAPIFGVAIFSFMTYWLSLEMVIQIQQRSIRPMVWVSMSLFVLLNALLPLGPVHSDKKLKVRVVQANVGNFLKVASESGDVDSLKSITERYQELSVKNPSFNPDLIIWPETAYPHSFSVNDENLPVIFQTIMAQTQAEILIGGYVDDPTKDPYDRYESVYNSSILMGENKLRSSYFKNILIPFGETLPFGPFNQGIAQIVPAVSLFARGEGTPLMETKSGLRFVTPICYEILETNYMRNLLTIWGGNHFIVNHTNDSWYGDTAEPFQHLFLSKWRALEFQLPIIRSTNTGVTSIIFPDGSESKRLGIGERDILENTIEIREPSETVYLQWGFIPTLLVALFLGMITFWKEKNEILL